jgi:hypothetical protein
MNTQTETVVWRSEDVSKSSVTIETAASEINLGERWWLFAEDRTDFVAIFLTRHDLENLRRALERELDGPRCGCENETCEREHLAGGCSETGTVACEYVGQLCAGCAAFMAPEFLGTELDGPRVGS